ncbi:hypothetical protein [Telluria aromaticivorans]|uniref:Uncharacterized protein n=1 Tax=Telluria aromaticivorans TaxID=2725995 RepID=A0A7Y2P114_9BURK|nr:hypothetical protein [Telluria aromaticivorans]NNG24101.1 hypothetical protein [Telluria aromaticivorans]
MSDWLVALMWEAVTPCFGGTRKLPYTQAYAESLTGANVEVLLLELSEIREGVMPFVAVACVAAGATAVVILDRLVQPIKNCASKVSR